MCAPIVFTYCGIVAGVLPATSDLVQLREEQLKGSVEDKCLVLDIQASRAVVMKAGDAIGLDPRQFILLEALPFSSLGGKRLGKRQQGHVDQGQLRGLKQVLMRLAFWRT